MIDPSKNPNPICRELYNQTANMTETLNPYDLYRIDGSIYN